MRLLSRYAAPILLLLLAAAPVCAAPAVVEARIDGAIHGITEEYISRAVERAQESNADLLLILMDTPGGLVSSMEAINKSIVASRVPVAVFVSPSGSGAVSAGFYITLSADVAAMSPGTRIGAAHPVTPFGENKKDDIMMQKAENDLAAQARTIAQNRGRNAETAEKIVRDSISLTEREALEAGIVDLVARDVPDLLEKLEGRSVQRWSGEKVTLHVKGAAVQPFEMTNRQRMLSVISDPSVAFILFVIGVLGLWFEFTHPGTIAPGVIGAAALILFAVATQILPVNLLGLLLIAAGIAMLVLEIKVTSFGLLTAGGIAAITAGFVVLFEGPIPEMRLPLTAILPTSLTVAGVMAFLTHRAIRAQRWKVTTGEEGLRGEVGTAVTEIGEEGKVFVHGEYWNATSRDRIPAGLRVRVSAVRDMVVEVERAETELT